MIRKEDFAVIKSLAQRGVYQKDIALELGVHPRTVSRALKRNGALWLREKTVATGAFIAKWVIVGEKVELTLAGGF